MDDKTKYEVIMRVQKSMAPKDIAEELDLSYPAVLRVQAQYKDAVIAGNVDKLVNMDELMVTELANKYPIDAVNKLTESINGLEVLSAELQSTATQINLKAKSLVMSVDSPSELSELTEIVCKLQNAFFNKNSTQVNVQTNNYGESNDNPYNQYLADTPGVVNN